LRPGANEVAGRRKRGLLPFSRAAAATKHDADNAKTLEIDLRQ